MNKLLKVLLCGLIAVSLLGGCSNKNDENTENNNTNDQVTETTPTPDAEGETVNTESVGTQLLAAFNEYMSANPEATALEIANEIGSNPIIPFEAAAMEIEPGYLNGFDNAEITGFDAGVMFAPMMGTIPFVGYIFTLPADADVDAFITTLKDSANLRWNICTEADEMTVSNSGNTIFFLMAPLSFEDAQ